MPDKKMPDKKRPDKKRPGEKMPAKKWQLQEAKNKLSQVAEEAVAYGPQVITKRGEDAVVVMSKADYDRLTEPGATVSPGVVGERMDQHAIRSVPQTEGAVARAVTGART